MLQKCPYIPWCISRTSFPEKHIKATGWTILLSRMKTCVDFTCGKTRRIAMRCVYVYIFMIIHLLSLSWSSWREKRAYCTIRGECPFSHAPPSSSPRRVLPSKGKGALATRFVPHFSHSRFLFPAAFFLLLWESRECITFRSLQCFSWHYDNLDVRHFMF